MKFCIRVKETLMREVDIEADCKIEALIKASDMYNREEIVLTADDYQETVISVHKKRKEAA